MASHEYKSQARDSDSDSELVFEDAMENLRDSKTDSCKDEEMRAEVKKEQSGNGKESAQQNDTSNNKDIQLQGSKEKSEDENIKVHKEDYRSEDKESEGVDSESEGDSIDEVDEAEVDALIKGATEEPKPNPEEEYVEECTELEDDEDEKEEMKIDDNLLSERDAKLSEEEREALKEKAQALKAEGNRLFKEGEYDASVMEYTHALQTCPVCFAKERSIMYSNRAASRLHLEKNEYAIKDCTRALELNPNYLKALLRRAELYEKTDKLDEALTDYQKVVEMDPTQGAAREACMRLPDQIAERNEKMKEEMLGKLKDLGNLVLRPFGLSTENFKLQQDPNTGGYSISFQQGGAKK